MDDAPEGSRTSDYNKEENSYSANNYESGEPVGFKPFNDDSEIKGFSI
jgi:hypothetical protein